VSQAGKTVAESTVTFVRTMTQIDANLAGNVHGGVIMKEVDSAAGTAAIRHAGRPCVTAAIDELAFLGPVYVGDILTVTATVNDVGRTSMEVGVEVEAESYMGGEKRHTTSAYLVMVALDDSGHPTEIPPLITSTPEEDRRRAQAKVRREIRKERAARISGAGQT
jgi:acyl-CoA hydrolase